MNANNSFRVSITALTVATIVGSVVLLFNGLSQFQFRPKANVKALASSADQKLRNRFGEFYPEETRRPAALSNSPAPNVMHTASHTTTFDELSTSQGNTAEVAASWSPGASAGAPQVSVPVTINVNNGELMAQLIETRESLAEMKAQQSATQQSQRVFSYQIHTDELNSVKNTAVSAAISETADVNSVHPRSSSESSQQSSEILSASVKNTVRMTARMPLHSQTKSLHQVTEHRNPAGDSSTNKPVKESTPDPSGMRARGDAPMIEFESKTKKASVEESSEFSTEEDFSIEPIPAPYVPEAHEDSSSSEVDRNTEDADREDADSSLNVIEPISYQVEEAHERSQYAEEETVVQFAPLDEAASSSEPPATLPELSFEQSSSFETPSTSTGSQPPATAKSGRKRDGLESRFAALRDLPPEDLFGDHKGPFVTPTEPAEPVLGDARPNFKGTHSDSDVAVDLPSGENEIPSAPPTISFIESADDRLLVHTSSAASPVELEYGEPSMPRPALTADENPGSAESPAMPLVEQTPERWHKYRSRVYLKQNSAPSTPVPPVPEIAISEQPESPAVASQTPPPVPPAFDGSFAESSSSSEPTITDSPLMIPDDDGSTEVAQNVDSEKLGSTSLPPVPDLAPVPELSSIPDLHPIPEPQFHPETTPADGALVYEPQPVMETFNEVNAGLNVPGLTYSSPSVMSPRNMPPKSTSKLPFSTTYRRIHKRVAWLAGATNSFEEKILKQKPTTTPSPVIEGPQSRPSNPSRGHGLAKKSSTARPMELPKLKVPKFAVQNFALPNVNFRAIQTPSFQMPMLDTPDWLACPPDLMSPVRNSNTLHRVISTMQFAGQSKVVK